MNWYLKVLKNYMQFEGRASREEYWMFILFNSVFVYIMMTLDAIFFRQISWFYILYMFIVFIPSLALTVRRLHDINKSGWMIFINLIPLVGFIWFLILMIKKSDQNGNTYGSNPLEIDIKEDGLSTVENIILAVLGWILISKTVWALEFAQYFDIRIVRDWMFIDSMLRVLVPFVLVFSFKSKPIRIILFLVSGILALNTLMVSVDFYL